MPGTTTLTGVTLPGKGRRRGGEVFDVVLTPVGITVERPGRAPRRLPWEQITEWELEQRGGSVRLVLRGGGAVTTLVVPRWSVGDLDAALRHTAAPATVPDPVEPADPVA
jgi:Bacterial PH domain